MAPRTRIMWIENKTRGDGLAGPVRIGRVTFNRSGKTLTYAGRKFESLKGAGYKANYVDTASGHHYWISGCRKDGRDALYNTEVQIDPDVRIEYWTEIRNQPDQIDVTGFRARGKYGA